MCHPTEIVTGTTTVAVAVPCVVNFRLRRFLGNGMGVLKNLRARGLNPHRVRNRQLIEQGGDSLEQCWGKKLLVFRGQRRYKPDIHTTPTLALGDDLRSTNQLAARDDFAISVPRCAVIPMQDCRRF